ncbi:hypothetical protein MG293_011095 [Ovis ammon polii]|uniref:Uncharacterized protein n=1 Tax=Ovis ammon polii TaxID=230172 RepID=A0AAD4Y8V5_OVIAM|nr:hypothetical protein MG293_011095 [Ovis ammon polii]
MGALTTGKAEAAIQAVAEWLLEWYLVILLDVCPPRSRKPATLGHTQVNQECEVTGPGEMALGVTHPPREHLEWKQAWAALVDMPGGAFKSMLAFIIDVPENQVVGKGQSLGEYFSECSVLWNFYYGEIFGDFYICGGRLSLADTSSGPCGNQGPSEVRSSGPGSKRRPSNDQGLMSEDQGLT